MDHPIEGLDGGTQKALADLTGLIECAIELLKDPAVKVAQDRDGDIMAHLLVLEFCIIEFLQVNELPELPLRSEAILVHLAAKFPDLPPAAECFAQTLAWHEEHEKTRRPAEVIDLAKFGRKFMREIGDEFGDPSRTTDKEEDNL